MLKIKHLLILIIATIAFHAYADNQPTENIMYFTSGTTIESFDSTGYPESHSIEFNNTWGGVQVLPQKNQLIVYAYRENSFLPVNWVRNGLQRLSIPWSVYFMTTPLGAQIPPTDLYFAILGTLTFNYKESNSSSTYSCKNVYIAQGSSGSRNNWWIFNNNNTTYHSIYCTDIKSNAGFFFQISKADILSVNGFTLRKINP